MRETDWIMSDGGPLILMERRLKRSWGGIFSRSVDDKSRTESDYERACQGSSLLFTVPLLAGTAVVLGDMPLNTTFRHSDDGCFYVVRLRWAEPAADIEDMLSKIDESALLPLEGSIGFTVETPELVLFDSAASGEENEPSIEASISAGKYRISTYIFDPDRLTSTYLHKFMKD